MTGWLNQAGTFWAQWFLWMNIQNTVFLVVLFLILYIFRKAPVSFRYPLSLLGVVKLLIPPLIPIGISTNPFGVPAGRLPLDSVVSATSSVTVSLSLSAIVMILWALGMISFLVWHVWHYWHFHWQLRRVCFPTGSLGDITIYQSRLNHSPFACGFFRKKIILPDAARRWSPELRQLVVTHEILHFRHRDPWLSALQLVVQAVYFYHPLVWKLNASISLLREVRCDSRTLQSLRWTPGPYFRALLQIAETTLPHGFRGSLRIGLFEPFQLLKQRIHHQFHYYKQEVIMNRKRRVFYWAVFLGVGLLMGILSCQVESQREDSTAPGPPVPTASITSSNAAVVPFSELTAPPKVVRRVEPVYPESARRSGIEGRVILKVLVNEQGKVEQTQVIQSEPELEQAAIAAVKQFEFTPPKKGNKAVKVWLVVPFQFRLKN